MAANMKTMHILCVIVATLLHPAITGNSTGDSSVHVKDAVQVSATKLYLQKGKTQRITCLLDYKDAVVISFYRVLSTPDGNSRELLLRSAETLNGGNYSAGPRYQFTPDYRLVIVSVEEGDSGMYQCLKLSSVAADKMENIVEVVVLDKLFPPVRGLLREGVNITVLRDAKDISLSCPIKEASTLSRRTLYWTTEVNTNDDETRIIGIAFSDGQLANFDGYKVSANDLLLATAPSAKRTSFFCHVSSTADVFYLQSAKVSVEVSDDNSAAVGIAVSVVVIFLLLVALLVFVCYKRKCKKRIFGRGGHVYISLSSNMEAPEIDAGAGIEWKHECNLGPKGIIKQNGNPFLSIKSIAVLNASDLAVLDSSGVHIFSADLALLKHFTTMLQPAENYVAMVSHQGQKALLLGAQNGTVSSLSLKHCEEVFCSLSPEHHGRDEMESGHGKKSSKPNGKLSSATAAPNQGTAVLTSMTVDENGNIYVGDETTNTVTAFYSNGSLMNIYPLQFPPRILAARSAGELFALSEQNEIKIFTTAMGKAHGRVFIKSNRILNPVNLIVDDSSMFVVNDTRCNGQKEVIQYDKNGNFVRQFAKPWRGIHGLCTFRSDDREILAICDEKIVRIYRKIKKT